ncbi:uncharacterized protein LOC125779363 isoform X3 [Bactrocera dorsalis]|nr:uncharacterized protein LOC125779363 isoform X3 [Bactrocera dorsalis]
MEQTGLNKKRIKREKPNKKRSEKEIQSILDFLQDAPEVELIESTKIDATWDLIRWKVRHLKASYKKASDWRMSTGAGLLESDTGTSSVEGKVLQMCSHFNQLKHIFGKKATSELPFEVVDSGSTSIMNESAANQILEITFSDVGEEIASPIDITNIENLPPGNLTGNASVANTSYYNNIINKFAIKFIDNTTTNKRAFCSRIKINRKDLTL